MNRDPIPFIEELGYTPREATFLYAVGMHSGYFLRRQFDGYIGRVKGAISQHFLNKAERRGHIRGLDYGQNRKVFHSTGSRSIDCWATRTPSTGA